MPRAVRIVPALLAVLVAGGVAASAGGGARGGAETSVCGLLREPLAFWQFRRLAGAPDARRIAHIRDIERLAFRTRDGRVLGGYVLRSAAPRGYLLVAQGNAMLADQIADALRYFRDRGLDVYVYDYRGYGLSQGRSRLAAIIADYGELVARLDALGYRRRTLYGLSMGGVVLLNAVGRHGDYDALVVDSSPSRISPLGCPRSLDPVDHLPADGARLKIIAGGRDRVVPPSEMAELLEAAARRHAQVLVDPGLAHPFQDPDPAAHRRRLREVADFLLR